MKNCTKVFVRFSFARNFFFRKILEPNFSKFFSESLKTLVQFFISFHLSYSTPKNSSRNAVKIRLKVSAFWNLLTSFVTSFSRKFRKRLGRIDSKFYGLSAELKIWPSQNFACKKFFKFILGIRGHRFAYSWFGFYKWKL